MKKILLFLSIIVFTACNEQVNSQNEIIPVAPDYTNVIYWYENPTSPADKQYDIFYIYPTLGTKPTDDKGNKLNYTNIDKESERLAANSNQRFNKNVYAGDNFNFFAPYYRQTTLEICKQGRESLKEHLSLPASDIERAFNYYMERHNNSRPFILLGHSQGSAMILELLKNMKPQYRKLMIAAYAMGYEITAEDLALHPDQLTPATGEDDTNVIISYNSITSLNAKSPLIDQTVVCINPLNWKTDGTPASKEQHKGIVKYDKQSGQYKVTKHFTSAYINSSNLICPDVDPASCYIAELGDCFPLGCLHMMDSWLYSVNIQENMILRSRNFKVKNINE